jgi:hypothetical protein
METKEKTIADKVIEGFKEAVVEMEELRLQVGLGKLEAQDLYEESKKKFNTYVHEAKTKLTTFKDSVSNNTTTVLTAFETLQVQLALGKAETKEAFEEQIKAINKGITELEAVILNNKTSNEIYTKLLMEIKKFKIKVEILKLRYELKEVDTEEIFEKKKKEFLINLAEIKLKMLGKSNDQKNKWEHFQDEINEAYGHLKNAFVNNTK